MDASFPIFCNHKIFYVSKNRKFLMCKDCKEIWFNEAQGILTADSDGNRNACH